MLLTSVIVQPPFVLSTISTNGGVVRIETGKKPSKITTIMEITVNDQPRQVADGITIADLLEQLQLSGKPVAVEVNLSLVPKAKHAKHQLAQGDRLEIVTLVGGG
jgi:sulfur carrier protein